MFVSGIGHVLSISGYHMAVVAGIVFFIVRAGLALIPGLADRAPIKKWSAFAALLVTAFYLVLSGAEVATQRSFIMIAIVLIGVMLDRPILTLRTVTIAALIVLLFAPEAVVHPSFQMSFAATLALIAGYERGIPWARAGARFFAGRPRGALGRARDVKPYSRFARRRSRHYALRRVSLSPHGALRRALQSPRHADRVGLGDAHGHSRRRRHSLRLRCNVLAADGLRHRMDGCGRALGREPAGRIWPRLRVRHRTAAAGDVGLLLVCLLKTPLRWSGVVFVALAIIFAARTPQPDILVAADGRIFAVRGADGRLAFHRAGGDTFTMREWLAADADGRDVRDLGLGAGITCDAAGCIGKLSDGRLVSYVLAPEAFEEDCQRAAVVVAAREAPPGCAATAIGRSTWREYGALTLSRDGSGFMHGVQRGRRISTGPGLRDNPRRHRGGLRRVRREHQRLRDSPPRDATPRSEDLEADD